jgi:hypothetical protein
MNNKGEVYLYLAGDEFDPDELSAFLGLQPTHAKRKGNLHPKYPYWVYSTGMMEDECIDIYKMSSRLAKILKQYSKKIIEAKKKFNLLAIWQIVVWIVTDDSISTPVIGLETDVIDFLSDIQASVDVDTYRKYE